MFIITIGLYDFCRSLDKISVNITDISIFLKGYVTVPSNSSGYGNIECNGNETKLEECTVRKNIHQTCSSTAVVIYCSTRKICMSGDKIHVTSSS